MREYLDTLDDAAWGAASEVKPKFVSRSDPAAQWTGALKGHAFFAYATNYLIDLDHAIIVDVEASRAIRQAEVGAARTMIERTEDRFGLYPERLAADSAYGSAEMLGWLVDERGIEPHIPVFDKSERSDGTFERADFTYDHGSDVYTCPAGKTLSLHRHAWSNDGATTVAIAPASATATSARSSRAAARRRQPARSCARSTRARATWPATSPRPSEGRRPARQRKKVEMLFAHLKRILRLDRLRLRGPNGARDDRLVPRARRSAAAHPAAATGSELPVPVPAAP